MHHVPIIQLLDQITWTGIEHSQKMYEHGLPYTEFKFMHYIWHEERVEINTKFCEAFGKRALS